MDLEGCKGVQHLRGLRLLQVCDNVTGPQPQRNNASKTHLDDLEVNGRGKGAGLLKVAFNCLKGQYPETLKGMDIF